MADRDTGLVVDREYRVTGEFLEQTVLDHHLCPTAALFGRLENKVDGPLEVPFLAEHFGGPQQHGRVTVMAAGVHAAGARRPMREIVGLVHRQAVHVGAKPDRLHRVALAQCADHAGFAEPARHFQPPLLKLGGHDVRCPVLLEGQFGMSMDVAADGRDLALDFE